MADVTRYHASMEAVADLVARHALLVLFGAILVLLIASAVFWRLVQRYAPACWRGVMKTWTVLAETRFAARAMDYPVLGRWLASTLTGARFLGVFSILAFAFAAGAVALFFELADELGADESLGCFDTILSAALREHLSHGTLRFFAAITRLGDPEFLISLSAVVAVILAALRRSLLAAAWIVATVGGGLMNWLLKAVFERTRPLHDHGLANETGWSFPSGHASGSMLVYGLLGYLIVRRVARPGGPHQPRADRLRRFEPRAPASPLPERHSRRLRIGRGVGCPVHRRPRGGSLAGVSSLKRCAAVQTDRVSEPNPGMP